MREVVLETRIHAPIERCFDLARSIELHGECYVHSHERAIAGRTAGLIEAGESVTFSYRELGAPYRLSVRIARLERPRCFEDVMVEGDFFARFTHRHTFSPLPPAATLMRDHFQFELRWPLLDRLGVAALMAAKVKRSLARRNQILKQCAESNDWRRFLSDPATGARHGDHQGMD